MDKPPINEFEKLLGGHNKILNFNELEERARKKRADYERTKAWVSKQGSIDDYVSVKPSKELALFEHYNSMPDIEIDPEVKEFWRTQQKGLADIEAKMKEPQNKFMNAYTNWQNLIESIDKDKRSQYRGSNFAKEERNAKKSIKEANERLNDANKKLKDTRLEVGPLDVFFDFMTGTDDNRQKLKDARQSKRTAQEGLEEAQRRLKEIKERKRLFQERMDEKTVKVNELKITMFEAREEMATNQVAAAQINVNSDTIAQSLHKQYETIDKFRAIQKLKQNLSVIGALESNNPELLKALKALPDSLPQNAFKITLQGPIQLPDNSNRIIDIGKKINDLQKQLPDINLDNLPDEIEKLKLKDTDKIKDIKQQMEGKDPDTQEYKQLKMKLDHLESKQKISDAEARIEQLKTEVRNANSAEKKNKITTRIKAKKAKISRDLISERKKVKEDIEAKKQALKIEFSKKLAQIIEKDGTYNQNKRKQLEDKLKEDLNNLNNERDKKLNQIANNAKRLLIELDKEEHRRLQTLYDNQQQLLRDLQLEQSQLKLLQENLPKDAYTKLLKELENKQKAYQKLLDEKASLESQNNLQNLDDIFSQLTSSTIRVDQQTLSEYYNSVIKSIKDKNLHKIRELEDKYRNLHSEKYEDVLDLPDPYDDGR